ncbi:protein SMALL AUXIN UP-REGULATED RNA 51-like [Cicer arietinum]|uniref:Auxin-responsive protein SAUR62-like n=1 Tax=Cicer arietinum TaxID=3827 RepID=A0A3Q7XBH8_CICAR|nr:auxin-responsive protein SAUR62-like [Cicer arietinum]
MEYGGGSKVTGIRQIVRLKEILQKWQSVTIGTKTPNLKPEDETDDSRSPIINKRIARIVSCDSDEESCQTPEPPPDVPKGYLAVYVGPELRRFIIPTTYLSHSLFKMLLEKAAEEFGFDQSGGLTIPCEIETFKYLLNCIENQEEKEQHHDNLSDKSETLEE